ncbi:MAG: hypothetical protein WCI73_08805 [Phycisphaerae bacterium]
MLYTLLLSLLTDRPGGGGARLLALPYLAQMLHATLLLLAALGVALAPIRLPPLGRLAAFLIILGTPWSIIIGTQAYNDAGMVLFGGLALVWSLGLVCPRPVEVRSRKDPRRWFLAALIGVLLGLALGCKLTAGVMFALPVAAIWLSCNRWKETLLSALLATMIFAPWSLRSYAVTGNPIFPIAASTLGPGPWSPEQVQHWNAAHSAAQEVGGASLGHRLMALAQASLLDDHWSISAANSERWSAETIAPPHADAGGWSHLGWIWGIWLAAATWGLWRGRTAHWPWRVGLALGLQVAGWLFLTHLQARFLWPILPTLTLLVVSIWSADTPPTSRGWQLLCQRGLALALAAAAVSTGFVVPQEFKPAAVSPQDASPLSREMFAGALLDYPTAALPESWFRNTEGKLEGLSENWRHTHEKKSERTAAAKLLLLGSATPYFYDANLIYTTAWDQPAWLHLLQSGDPQHISTWLHQQNIRLIVIDWTEMHRLHRSYATPEPLTPATIQTLIQSHQLQPLFPPAPIPCQVFLVPDQE